jgi:hypothetical protein
MTAPIGSAKTSSGLTASNALIARAALIAREAQPDTVARNVSRFIAEVPECGLLAAGKRNGIGMRRCATGLE